MHGQKKLTHAAPLTEHIVRVHVANQDSWSGSVTGGKKAKTDASMGRD